MPYKIPKNKNQNNVLLMWFDDNGTQCWLDWSLIVKAPVTKVMSTSEVQDYVVDNNYAADEVDVVEGQNIQDIIIDNKAGLNGVWLIWPEIVNLYRK
jgi:hypothetical protein